MTIGYIIPNRIHGWSEPFEQLVEANEGRIIFGPHMRPYNSFGVPANGLRGEWTWKMMNMRGIWWTFGIGIRNRRMLFMLSWNRRMTRLKEWDVLIVNGVEWDLICKNMNIMELDIPTNSELFGLETVQLVTFFSKRISHEKAWCRYRSKFVFVRKSSSIRKTSKNL